MTSRIVLLFKNLKPWSYYHPQPRTDYLLISILYHVNGFSYPSSYNTTLFTPSNSMLNKTFLPKNMFPKETVLAITGSHGKTSTTGMIWQGLNHIKKYNYYIGGTLNQTQRNASFKEGQPWIIEADDYDKTYLLIKKDIGIVTQLGQEHLERYENQYHQLITCYLQFIEQCHKVIINGDYPAWEFIQPHISTHT